MEIKQIFADVKGKLIEELRILAIITIKPSEYMTYDNRRIKNKLFEGRYLVFGKDTDGNMLKIIPSLGHFTAWDEMGAPATLITAKNRIVKDLKESFNVIDDIKWLKEVPEDIIRLNKKK